MPPRHPKIAQAIGHLRRSLPPVDARPSPTGVVVACSGGADSVAMLGLLHLVAPGEGLELAVAHVDHRLRPASADDARHVEALADELALPVDVEHLDLATGAGLAARARDARADALTRIAQRRGASIVALGHTASDQAETVVLHLVRGAGLDGLAAMRRYDDAARPARWRPLLDVTRAQARQLATLLGLPFVDDPTNDDREQARAFVRHEVIPRLSSMRDGVVSTIAGIADRARDAGDALDLWAAREAQARRDARGLSVAGWADLPRAVRARLLRGEAIAGGVDPDAVGHRVVEQIDLALLHPDAHPRTWDLRPARRLVVHDGWLRLEASRA